MLVNEEERRVRDAAARSKEGRGERSQDGTMPLAEVVENRRHNECVPSSARLANATKTGDPESTVTDLLQTGRTVVV